MKRIELRISDEQYQALSDRALKKKMKIHHYALHTLLQREDPVKEHPNEGMEAKIDKALTLLDQECKRREQRDRMLLHTSLSIMTSLQNTGGGLTQEALEEILEGVDMIMKR